MTMFQKTIFGDSRAVGMFSNRRGKQADLFGGLEPLRNDPPARQPLTGQADLFNAAQVKPEPFAATPVPCPDLAAPAYRCSVCKADIGWDAPSGVCSTECFNIGQDFGKPKPAPIDDAPMIDNVAGIIDLFSTAKANGLQWPKIRLALPGGMPVELSVVGSGKNEGKIRVTNGGKYGDYGTLFFGFIETNGRFSGRSEDILSVLVKFSVNPAQVAAEYGKGTGECCFCARPLTNGKAGSVEVGYGPICADKFGLPWQPNSKDYDMIVGSPVVQADTPKGWDAIEADDAKPCLDLVHVPRVVQATQAGLPSPKAMLALPSPMTLDEATAGLTEMTDEEADRLDMISSLEAELAELVAKQDHDVRWNRYARTTGDICFGPEELKARRSRISKLRARIVKLQASLDA